ncbi:hypothetical protein DQW50_11590 [Halorubrum sp. 48-1-W]|uniref:hypothetical protein n=1 Tax=Halorubrum sp. 48-1-W TaxID=2249761 RepID=UPI000DCB33DE|nr:hypothetical protein [Halorubrum sp. 48-1-W]RAW44955.1 hypothetical protein DQW50_11590 [Halorubrum sp. 48-1-W]
MIVDTDGVVRAANARVEVGALADGSGSDVADDGGSARFENHSVDSATVVGIVRDRTTGRP